MNNLGQLNNGIKSEFGHLNANFQASLNNGETNGLLRYALRGGFAQFENGGFADKCSVLGDAVSSGKFSEEQKEDLFIACPSLTQRCIADNTQLASLLKAVGLLSGLGGAPALFEPFIPFPVPDNDEVFENNVERWDALIAQARSSIQGLKADDIKLLSLQVLKFLEENSISEKERYLASLVLSNLVVENYSSFGFQTPGLAQEFAVHFMQSLMPDLADQINWKMIDKSINLTKVIKFSKAYKTHFEAGNEILLTEQIQDIASQNVQAAILPLNASITELRERINSLTEVQREAMRAQQRTMDRRIRSVTADITMNKEKIDSFIQSPEVSVLVGSMAQKMASWPPVIQGLEEDFENFLKNSRLLFPDSGAGLTNGGSFAAMRARLGMMRPKTSLIEAFKNYNNGKIYWPTLESAFIEVIKGNVGNIDILKGYWQTKGQNSQVSAPERLNFSRWLEAIQSLEAHAPKPDPIPQNRGW